MTRSQRRAMRELRKIGYPPRLAEQLALAVIRPAALRRMELLDRLSPEALASLTSADVRAWAAADVEEDYP